MPKTLTGVGCIICASHMSVDKKVMHGHTWEVTAWFRKLKNAACLQKELEVVCERYNHTLLPAEIAWGEALAAEILMRLKVWDCVEVHVSRPLERIYAKAIA